MTPNPRKKRRYPFKRQLRKKLRRFLFILITAALAGGVNYYQSNKSTPKHDNKSNHNKNTSIEHHKAGNYFSVKQQQQAIQKLRQASNKTNARFWVGLNAKIVQILKDDLKESRHQKFIISPEHGITLLVSHNIDLAERAQIYKGDKLSLFGRYEWNNRGGVIHWTHHDPRGLKSGGWIRANNKVYR